MLWIVFLVNYTLAIQTPDREFGVEGASNLQILTPRLLLFPTTADTDALLGRLSDYIFYIQVMGYTLEEIVRFTKIRSIAALTFWTCVSLLIYSIAFVALGYRIADLATHKEKAALHYRLLSFQILSWAELPWHVPLSDRPDTDCRFPLALRCDGTDAPRPSCGPSFSQCLICSASLGACRSSSAA